MNRVIRLTGTIYTPDQLSLPDVPQIALAGRSNVGKSSLINALAGTKKLAKVSGTPGKTRSINLYHVSPAGYYLVDLPGYGYARCSKQERQSWASLIDAYISKATSLCAVAMLIDCRHSPQLLDLELGSYLRQIGMPILVVLTKADQCKQAERAKRQREWTEILGEIHRPVPFSARTGQGREELWQALDSAVGSVPG
ncbi:ribosome biogenesis GTP-binding protein YsxC/EngB [Desulfocurvibacter africanus PCS]|uniref:Probable GTP-binding protein EngB n=1 Tax=Desulfocurvibacter africanus PCS TaxID=1262666 RepID=M5Q3Q4_DESAF|nr:ribosome biogenesis GTP-binding protein YihA/YsxC [Desulfocurvibacter africanus]EMG38853.1 ribosome biogenesis GTP-binding protein YsxC/EngB [Desulfocurvibacter africanus PCS]